jgi:hypothetical protein
MPPDSADTTTVGKIWEIVRGQPIAKLWALAGALVILTVGLVAFGGWLQLARDDIRISKLTGFINRLTAELAPRKSSLRPKLIVNSTRLKLTGKRLLV